MDPLEHLQDPVLMHFQFIFNLMQAYQNNLKFFDIRDQESFDECHLRIAIHVPTNEGKITSDLLKRITGERELSRLRRYCLIIAYCSPHMEEFLQFKSFLDSLKCKEIHILSDFDSFLSNYYFLCSNFRPIRVKEFPNEVIPKTLYLGTQVHAQCRESLEILQVTHILNVTRGPSILFPGLKYCRVYIEDSESEKISFFFQKAYEFIENAFIENVEGAKNVVLVHCAKGVSRSATIVIMFLMRSTGMTFDEALAFVKRHRSIVEPNEGFVRELKDFEARHYEFVRRTSSLCRFHTCFEKEVKM
jgi:protein-tyrosine phosphatase